MRALRRAIGWSAACLAILAGLLLLWAWVRGRPQDLPWTPLDLSQPVGLFTGAKLAALGRDFPRCRALLDAAGVRYNVLPPRTDGGRCGYADGVRFAAGGSRRIGLRPAELGVACPVAAALAKWEWDVVQPAAQRRFGRRVATIDHFGSYSCRRLYGRDAGSWSEHATADAVDIAGFRLSDGTRVTVVGDWSGGGAKAAFLRDVRDGACTLFATTLSPDYNAAHRDHLHLDQADRGRTGWRACR
ncbi:extensin family protein [Sphingomonas sp. A2-49]|uniref:extensin-like domain-containing protein n=1 Tax=Sphingomonas sp. A2-49 TaxID=1391375 RepID=UPI0021CF09E1|nr:extensin family protein [Sphingomonas sp. A2-49]MCU6455393.1 extensin family protein [Sphingomonas sp. A2-49]